jgi:hypothetical protein
MNNATTMRGNERDLKIEYVSIESLSSPDYNPRVWNEENTKQLKESISKFGIVDPLLVNNTPERKGIVIGGNFRMKVLKELGITEVPVVYTTISDIEKEKELCLRLNKNQGEWDLELLSKFDESFLGTLGFDSEELDKIFDDEKKEEQFDLKKELDKIGIENINVQKADVYCKYRQDFFQGKTRRIGKAASDPIDNTLPRCLLLAKPPEYGANVNVKAFFRQVVSDVETSTQLIQVGFWVKGNPSDLKRVRPISCTQCFDIQHNMLHVASSAFCALLMRSC